MPNQLPVHILVGVLWQHTVKRRKQGVRENDRLANKYKWLSSTPSHDCLHASKLVYLFIRLLIKWLTHPGNKLIFNRNRYCYLLISHDYFSNKIKGGESQIDTSRRVLIRWRQYLLWWWWHRKPHHCGIVLSPGLVMSTCGLDSGLHCGYTIIWIKRRNTCYTYLHLITALYIPMPVRGRVMHVNPSHLGWGCHNCDIYYLI